MFDRIVPRYDLLNRLLSCGQDIHWRRNVARRLPAGSARILDLACGTADLAIEIARQNPHASVIGLDFSPNMLAAARRKIAHRQLAHRVTVVPGDALALPFGANRFDAATIAFGLRNLPNRLDGLREMARVVRPGGTVVVLEMTRPGRRLARSFFDWYLKRWMPFVGGLISGDRAAYSYLPASIQGFLRPDELCDLLGEAGLVRPSAHSLSGGICWIHAGAVPSPPGVDRAGS